LVPRDHLIVANKIGLAYGFMSEAAYIEDRTTGRAFVLGMTMYVNDNAVLNDGDYQYGLAEKVFADVAGCFAHRYLKPELEAVPVRWRHTPIKPISHAMILSAGEEWTSEVYAAPTGMVELVPSWNVTPSGEVGVRLEVRVEHHDEWSPWLAIAEYGCLAPSDAWQTNARAANTNVDTLKVSGGATAFQFRARAGQAARSTIERLDVIVTTRVDHPEYVPDDRLDGRVEASNVFLANDNPREELDSRLCSPLSVRTLLASRGIEVTTLDVADAAYDHRFKIYGNWTNAIATLRDFGVRGRLARFSDWAQVRKHFESVGPIAFSASFTEDELSGAGYSSPGHLIVAYGFDENGDVLVLDPAYSSDESESRRVYSRDELSKVWLDRVKGLAYVVEDVIQQEAE
ncbi:MAG: C39 family peptidase, partial [Planctomycetota bacterium]